VCGVPGKGCVVVALALERSTSILPKSGICWQDSGVDALTLHPWRVSYRQAVAIQESLGGRLRLEPLRRSVSLVAGADVAYSRATHRMYAAVVVVRLPSLEIVETARSVSRARFPYIPGLFTFREVPPLLRAFRRLEARPDALLFDGHGLAHPRRFGLACHAGLLLQAPSVGCAKSRLVGTHGAVGASRGSTADLVLGGDQVGAVLRTRLGVKPVYVSPGHLVDLPSAVALVLATTGRFRIPEPIRLAHQATSAMLQALDARVLRGGVRTYPDFIAE
jgi:deoxyribonuclease V